MTQRHDLFFKCAAVLTGLFACQSALSTPQGFMQRDAFDAAVNALSADTATVDFDDFPNETQLPSGATVDGVSFVYDFSGEQLDVRAVTDSGRFDTTSTPFFLANTDAGVLQDGDDLTLAFDQPLHAFGLFVTVADELVDGDLELAANAFAVELDATAIVGILNDGARVYFLGIVSPTETFTSATLSTNGGGFFLYALDDLELAVAPDDDGDGVADAVDNCLLAVNPGQVDSDGDNIGNACDADIGMPNNCVVNVIDLGVLRLAFFGTPGTANWNPDADFNSDGVVNVQDLGIMRQLFFGTPGPSALENACAP